VRLSRDRKRWACDRRARARGCVTPCSLRAMPVCMSVCVCVCVICVYVCMGVCVCEYVCMCVCICVCVYVYMSICVCTSTRTRTFMRIVQKRPRKRPRKRPSIVKRDLEREYTMRIVHVHAHTSTCPKATLRGGHMHIGVHTGVHIASFFREQ